MRLTQFSLLVEGRLLASADVPAVQVRHGALFGPNRILLVMKLSHLGIHQLAFLRFVVDPLGLFLPASCALVRATMILLQWRVRQGGGANRGCE